MKYIEIVKLYFSIYFFKYVKNFDYYINFIKIKDILLYLLKKKS